MTRRPLLLFLALLILAAPWAWAEDSGRRKVKTLVDYRSELALTDQQVEDIGAALKAFQATLTEQRKLQKQYESEYAKLLAERAPLDQIKQKLRQVTDTNFQLRYADVLTSRKVESILRSDQLAKWRAIQNQVRQAP